MINNANDTNKNDTKTGNIDNTILFYIYYPESSIESDAIIIEKQMEIALLSKLSQINIGLYNISENNSTISSIIDNITKNAKMRLTTRYRMEKKQIEDLNINVIYINNNLTNVLDVLLYETYYFPTKLEDKKNIKGKYSFVLLNDGYNMIYNKQNNIKIKTENKIVTTIKNELNPTIIFTKISFNENIAKLSSTYIRNIAITSNYEKFESMMMKLGYSKKNSDAILNVIRNSSDVMTMGDIFNKTTSMMADLGSKLYTKLNDTISNSNNANNANNINNLNGNGTVYAINGGNNKLKTSKRKTSKRKTSNQFKQKKQKKTKTKRKRKTKKYNHHII
jgi:hypothetical protein